MSRKKIVNDKDGKLVEIDQDKIEAALAGAVSMANGAKLPEPTERRETPCENTPCAITKNEEPDVKPTDECCKDNCEPQEVETGDSGQIAMSQNQFIEACHNLTINAKQCFYQSSKHPDRSVDEYIRSINKKIFGETQKGGYSTNVQFRVTPQDWINVNHIFDWYKNRGFSVDVQETTSSPYGKDVGTMNYSFTISWTNA